jgi:hypothetical protein
MDGILRLRKAADDQQKAGIDKKHKGAAQRNFHRPGLLAIRLNIELGISDNDLRKTESSIYPSNTGIDKRIGCSSKGIASLVTGEIMYRSD